MILKAPLKTMTNSRRPRHPVVVVDDGRTCRDRKGPGKDVEGANTLLRKSKNAEGDA
jgi:hypothetical protein